MLFKNIKFALVGAAVSGLTTGAYAEAGPKVGFEYHGAYNYNDGGYMKTTGVDAEASGSIDLEDATVSVSGDANDKLSYSFDYDFSAMELGDAYAKYKAHEMVSLSVGQQEVHQGGWLVKDSLEVHTDAAEAYHGPFDDNAPMFGIHAAAAGEVSLQLLNDVNKDCTTTSATTTGTVDADGDGEMDEVTTTTTECENPTYKNDSTKGPAYVLEWQGDFAGWMPLIQIGSYDLNKSMYYSLGVKGEVAGLGVMVNFLADNRKAFGANYKEKGEVQAHQAFDLELKYAVAGFTPWIDYHMYSVKQKPTDSKVNSADGVYDDNAQAMGLGVECNAMGEGYIPYIAFIQDSGKFTDPSDGEKESRNTLHIKLGVYGSF